MEVLCTEYDLFIYTKSCTKCPWKFYFLKQKGERERERERVKKKLMLLQCSLNKYKWLKYNVHLICSKSV